MNAAFGLKGSAKTNILLISKVKLDIFRRLLQWQKKRFQWCCAFVLARYHSANGDRGDKSPSITGIQNIQWWDEIALVPFSAPQSFMKNFEIMWDIDSIKDVTITVTFSEPKFVIVFVGIMFLIHRVGKFFEMTTHELSIAHKHRV